MSNENNGNNQQAMMQQQMQMMKRQQAAAMVQNFIFCGTLKTYDILKILGMNGANFVSLPQMSFYGNNISWTLKQQIFNHYLEILKASLDADADSKDVAVSLGTDILAAIQYSQQIGNQLRMQAMMQFNQQNPQQNGMMGGMGMNPMMGGMGMNPMMGGMNMGMGMGMNPMMGGYGMNMGMGMGMNPMMGGMYNQQPVQPQQAQSDASGKLQNTINVIMQYSNADIDPLVFLQCFARVVSKYESPDAYFEFDDQVEYSIKTAFVNAIQCNPQVEGIAYMFQWNAQQQMYSNMMKQQGNNQQNPQQNMMGGYGMNMGMGMGMNPMMGGYGMNMGMGMGGMGMNPMMGCGMGMPGMQC